MRITVIIDKAVKDTANTYAKQLDTDGGEYTFRDGIMVVTDQGAEKLWSSVIVRDELIPQIEAFASALNAEIVNEKMPHEIWTERGWTIPQEAMI